MSRLLIYYTLHSLWTEGGQPDGTTGAPITVDMDAATKLATVNSWQIPGVGYADVPISSIQGFLSLEGVLTAMEDWIAVNTTPSLVRTAIKELFRTISTTRLNVVEMSRPETFTAVSAMITAAIGAGVMTSDQGAVLLAMAAVPASPWWKTISAGPLTLDEIQEAIG